MKKLEDIRIKCQESIDDYNEVEDTDLAKYSSEFQLEKGRAELAEEILEILNGVKE